MSEMVDRVVQAMHTELCNPSYGPYLHCGELTDGAATVDGEVQFDELAVAAIKAQRVPTEAMLVAARDWSYQKYGKPVGNDAAIGCWNAMIDAALKE